MAKELLAESLADAALKLRQQGIDGNVTGGCVGSQSGSLASGLDRPASLRMRHVSLPGRDISPA
jgi:hypothetical protein